MGGYKMGRSNLAFLYFLFVTSILMFLSCSSKEHKGDEKVIRIDQANLRFSKPLVEKELPIFDPKIAFFEFNRAALTEEAKKALVPTAQFLKENPGVRLVVEGYCDERGSEEYNMKLGLRRAESVKTFLLRRGVHGNRIETVSYGRLIGNGDRIWAQNRRAGFEMVYPRAE